MDRRLLLSTALSAGAALALALQAHAQPAPNARPSGGSVVAGSATIAQSSTTTTIDQSTQRAAINWQSFDIGSQQTVQFEQPSSSAIALNRVVGPNPSEIAGRIDANGQVLITNQSGVVFYKGSQVNTAGLMVSAAGIGNANFMAGRMVFDQAAKPDAKVVNQGSITVADAGLAALVAPQVANSGVITARLGHVVLAGAETATLDLYGDGLMAIDVTGQVVQTPSGATALVTNSGIIRADGGTVQLTARAADGIVQTLVDAGGTVRANTKGDHTGSIVLNGVGGSITIAGQLTATGSAPGSTGGNVEVDPSGSVTLARTARIDASGRAGGGIVAIGTTLARAKGGRGVTAMQTAASVTVAAGATIAANATSNGNGGRVAVLSGGSTVMNGAISAQGGPNGGNGGTVETSGHTLTVGSSATVDTLAAHGLTGMWLLDPTNVVIAITGGTETPATVETGLLTTDETIAADNDITVTDAITANPKETHSLFLEAGRSILLNNSITLHGGFFSATANDSNDLGTALADRGPGPGAFMMASGVTIDTSFNTQGIFVSVGASASNTGGGGDFTPGAISLANLTTGGGTVFAGGGSNLTLNGDLNAGTGGVTLGTTSAGGIALDGAIKAGLLLLGAGDGGLTQDAAETITATELGIDSAGSVNLVGANAVPVLAASVTGSGGSFSFRDDSTPLTIGTVVTNPDPNSTIRGITTNDGRIAVATTTSGGVTANQQIASTGGEVDIAVAPGSTFTNNTDNTAGPATAISSGNGNVVVLADSMTFAANSTINAGSGTVVLGPATTGDSIVLGAPSSAGTLGLQTSELATITAGMIEVGYRTEAATASFTGGISVGGAGITLNPLDAPVLVLVTGGAGGTVTQTEPITFSAAGGTLGIIAGGNVTLNGANAVSTFAGFADNASTISFTNNGPLTVGAAPAEKLGVAVDPATGLASSAPMSSGTGLPSNPLAGVTAIGGGNVTVATSTGNLTLGSDVTATGQTVTLASAGTIDQTGGVITAGTQTGSSVGGASLTLGNLVGLFGSFTDTGAGSTGIAFTDAQTLGTTGTVSSASGPITLTTKGTGSNLTLGGAVTASGNTVTLDSAGTIGQTGGVITAATLTGNSVGGASLIQGNLVTSLGAFTDTGADSTGIAFTDAEAFGTTGTVSSASGPVTLTTTGAGSNLTLGSDVTANGQTVTLTSAGTIDQTDGAISASTLTGSSAGGTTLTDPNVIGTLGPFTAASLALFDGGPLTISGPVTADFLTITATGRMTLAGNIATVGAPLSQQSGGTPAPGGSTLQVVAAGAQFVQDGTSLLTDPPGTTLRIQLPATGGTATFANLDGPGANLVLGLGTGTASGTMEVGGLLVLGQSGSATLVGSVDGVTTRAAAALGQIIPAIDPSYTFNGCIIGAAICGAPTPPLLLPPVVGITWLYPGPGLPLVEPLPTLDLIVLVTPPLLTGELAPEDVVPPNISFVDY